MNEIEIIRSQLTAEQSHATEIANACAAALGSAAAPPADEATARVREACVSYLVWVLARFEERDQTLVERLAARSSPASGESAAAAHPVGGVIGRSGTSREALARLEAALAARGAEAGRSAWQEFAGFFNSAWAPRRAALERALEEHATVADWRAVCAIDADSILEERSRYARARAQFPAGSGLRGTPSASP